MESKSSSLQSADYVAVLRRRRRLIASVFLPVFTAGLVFALGLPDVYRSTAVIGVEEAKIAGYLSTADSGRSYVDKYVASLSDRVLSKERIGKFLAEAQPYTEAADPGKAAARVRKDLSVDMVKTRILDPNSGREREVISAFSVSFDSSDAEKARDGAVWFTQAYFDANRENRQRREQGAAGFLGGEADKYRETIAQLEKQLAEFKQRNLGNLPELNDVNMNMMDRAERDLENVELQLRTLRQDRVFLAQQLSQALATSPESNRIPQLEAEYQRKAETYDESHPDMISLRQQIDSLKSSGGGGMSLQAQLQSQESALAQALLRYSADHPDVRRIQRRIANLEARISSGESAVDNPSSRSPAAIQLQTQINAVDTQIGALQGRSIEVRGKVGTLEQRLESTPQAEREFQKIDRELGLARNKYEELLKRQMDADVAAAAIAVGAADEFQLVQTAAVPGRPVKPQRFAIGAVGLLLGLILALGAAIMAEALDPRVRGSRDVREILGVTPLAMVPEILTEEIGRARKRLAFGYLGAMAGLGVVGIAALRLFA